MLKTTETDVKYLPKGEQKSHNGEYSNAFICLKL